MTVAALSPSAGYLENGVTLAFAAPFRFLDPTHLEVKRIAVDGTVTVLAYGVDYTVTGGSTDAGGTVTLIASTSGATLKIRRVTPRAQQTDYVTNDTFPAESHEAALDRQMLIDQEQDVKIEDTAKRALMWPEGEQALQLPPKAAFAGKFFAGDAEGDLVPASGTGSDPALRTDLASGLLGALLIAWKANGIGAVVRSLWAKLADLPFSGKDFGAVGDDLSDDTAEIQAAVDALILAGGGILHLPKGIYKISADINVTGPILIRGDGASKTIIRQANPAAGGINFNFSSLVQGGGVEDISFEAGAGWIRSGYQGSGSTGVGIAVRNSNGKFYARNFGVHNFDTGIRIRGSFYTAWSHFEVLYATTDGILIDTSDGTSGGTIGAGNWLKNAKVSNFGFTGTNTGSTGIRMLAGGGDFFASVDVTTFNKGWRVAPTTGKQVLYGFFTSCLGDSCLSHNWEFDGTNGNVWSMSLEGCWGAYSTNGFGLRVLGANVDSIRWNGGRLRENGQHGISHEGGINVSITGAEIASNGKAAAGTYHGINVAANVSQWAVSGCRIGNYASGFNTQQNGVNIAPGTSQNFTVNHNDLRGNLNQPLSLGTSSLLYTIVGNLPLQTPGLNISAAVPMSSSTPAAVAAGATVYLGPNGLANANANDSTWVVTRAGVVRELYAAVDAAPGGVQTNTYTVFRNGVATLMTATITGAGFLATSTANPFTVSPGDTLSIRLATSGAAAVAKHRYYLSQE